MTMMVSHAVCGSLHSDFLRCLVLITSTPHLELHHLLCGKTQVGAAASRRAPRKLECTLVQLGDGLVHVEECALFGYFADDLQQKGDRKCDSQVLGCRMPPSQPAFCYSNSHVGAGGSPLPCQPFASIQPHKALSILGEN